ncbi:MAG: DUF389 domain-containing protein, partial [Niveispirillum sp.]|uniref:DUF389 domain-containing protein n=1 Tax=Niveispirillum sp. TaxID=1917217 RepID=UPI004035162A
EEVYRSLVALGLGIILAVGFSALIVVLSPLQTVTAEIAARTRPNFFDLLVALFSGLAGAYAMVRGRHGAIVGVAIATGQLKRIETLLILWLGLSLVNFIRPMYTVEIVTSAQWAPLFAAGAFFFLVRQSGWTTRRRLALLGCAALACMYLWRENGQADSLEQLLALDD